MNNLSQLKNFIDIINDPSKTYEFLEQLGQGNYGSVYKAKNRITGEIVAVKVLPIASDIDSLKKEIDILKEC